MKGYFITGTSTGIGKTLTSAVLTFGLKGCYWKPIQSGTSDRECVQTLTELPDTHFFASNYALQASLSPDQAARLENITIDLKTCVMPETSRILLVEGAGGVFVPVNDNESIFDLMQKLHLPIVIVSRGTLGTINHTLLTIEALRHRKLEIHGVIFSGELNLESQRTIEKWGKVRTLLHIPFFENVSPATLQKWTSEHQSIIKENFA